MRGICKSRVKNKVRVWGIIKARVRMSEGGSEVGIRVRGCMLR